MADKIYDTVRIASSTLENLPLKGYRFRPKRPDEVKDNDRPSEVVVHRIPLEVLEEAFEIANGDHSLVVVDKDNGTATVYNSAELAIEALNKGNKQYPSRFTQFRFKSSKD